MTLVYKQIKTLTHCEYTVFCVFTGETVEGSVRGVQETCAQLGLEHVYYAGPSGMQEKWAQVIDWLCVL